MRKPIFGLIAVLAVILTLPVPVQAGRGGGPVEFFVEAGHPGWGRYPHHRWKHHARGPGYHRGGVVILRPWPTYRYEYYSPPPVIIREQPSFYGQPQEQEPYYWFYCQDPQGYYPYVRTCPGGWLKVVPETTPPGR